MSEIHVRAARSPDEATILALVRAEMEAQAAVDPRFRLRPDSPSRHALYLRNRMREIDSAVFLAERDGRVVGTATASVRIQEAFFEVRRYGYVSDLVVDPRDRRRGVGRALWHRATLWFRGLGVTVVRLHIAAESENARSFWESVGAAPFLLESWIDLPPADEGKTGEDRGAAREKPEGGEADASPGEAPAATAETAGGDG